MALVEQPAKKAVKSVIPILRENRHIRLEINAQAVGGTPTAAGETPALPRI
jgi:hypothetical protein